MTAPKFFVIEEAPCDECKGSGVIESPIWKLFWDEYKEKGCDKSASEIRKYFRDNCGWYEDELPAEEEICVECEGNKVIRKEVDLLYALAQIKSGSMASIAWQERAK